jgi:hypothetical protein
MKDTSKLKAIPFFSKTYFHTGSEKIRAVLFSVLNIGD